MTLDYTRGSIYDVDSNTTLDMGKVTDESPSLTGGIFRKAVPLSGAAYAIMESIWGRTRIITIQGFKVGTQRELEVFIKQFTDIVDVVGWSNTLRYYPLVHSDNTKYATGQQDGYWSVVINDFSYRISLRQAGFILYYDIEMFQGTRIKAGA